MKVYYEVTGKVIPYEQAEDEATRLIKLMTSVLTSDKIRTVKMQIARVKAKAKESKKENHRSDSLSNISELMRK